MTGSSVDFIAFEDLIAAAVLPGHDDRTIEGRSFTAPVHAAPAVAVVADQGGAAPARVALSQPLSVGKRQFQPGAIVEIGFGVLTTDGEIFHAIRISGENIGLAGPRPGQAFTVGRLLDLRAAAPLNCAEGFVAGTLIDTPDGPRAIDTLAPGAPVLTREGDTRAVQSVTRRQLSVPHQIAHPHLRPVLFAPGALENRHPLVVASGQRLQVSGWRVELLFGAPETCVPAATLVNDRSIRIAPLHGQVTLFQLAFDGDTAVTAEGVSCLCAPRGSEAATATTLADTLEPALSVARRLEPRAALLRPYQARHLRSR